MNIGKINPINDAKISFPGFQRIKDFTSAGGESSVSVVVDGDTDKEYIIYIRNLDSTNSVDMLIGADTSTYGFQYMQNAAGTVSAARDASESTIILCPPLSMADVYILSSAGFIKTIFTRYATFSSGTTISNIRNSGYSYDGTANFSTLDFSPSSGTFTAGTRIVAFVRRTQ